MSVGQVLEELVTNHKAGAVDVYDPRTGETHSEYNNCAVRVIGDGDDARLVAVFDVSPRAVNSAPLTAKGAKEGKTIKSVGSTRGFLTPNGANGCALSANITWRDQRS